MKKKSLTFKIFTSIFFIGTLIYLVCAVLFISNTYTYFEKQIFNELETEVSLLQHYAETNRTSELAELKTKNRITLIHPDGTVYFDNTVDISTLENHSTRSEFIGAIKNGTDSSSRFSETMTEKTLYFAKLLQNGDVIRISCNQQSVALIVIEIAQTLVAMLVIALFVSLTFAQVISKKIIEPLNKINFENPENAEVYEELKPFTKRIAEENFEKEQREELRKQFSANVSHELKTPLTSISGFAEILRTGETDKKTTIDFANTIYEQSKRMIELVNDIIKISKLDEKSISQEKETVSLREVTTDIFQILSATAKNKNVHLNISGSSGMIFGVRSVIHEMIYNLIDNAIKYNKPGGSVDVNINSLSKENSGEKENKVILIVKDTGIGIPHNEKERVFERFYRIEKSRSKELGGTGLGLSIVKHAAKYHNAIVTLDSDEGKGSTFTITFSGESVL
ncbi:MAG: sensor histidine kinase [Treponema sp.]